MNTKTFMELCAFLSVIGREESRQEYMSAQKFLDRYDIAKKSYEKYGEEGPPVGSFVKPLRSGYGNGYSKVKLEVCNPTEDYKSVGNTILLLRKPTNYPGEFFYYVCPLHIWWNEIQPV